MLAVTMKAPYFSGSFNPSAPRFASDPNFAPATNYDMVMQYGADDYLIKPIDFEALKRKIQAL
jgi:hypothetical protein